MVQLVSIVLAMASVATAYKTYVAKLPNGDKVAGNVAIGHDNPSGGGARNPFGIAFSSAGGKWTPELCKADSDNDGATNGEELGDPCCTWTVGSSLVSGIKATSPGTADKFTPDQLTALKCSTTSLSGGNTTKKSDAPPAATIVAPKPSSAATMSTTVAVAVAVLVAVRQ